METDFIVGVPRSGTTMVRMVFDSHPNVYSGSEMPWLGGNYGPAETSLRALYERMKRDDFTPISNETNIDEVYLKEIFREFILKIIKKQLSASGKRHWVEKTPDNIVQLPFLNELFPKSRYIHIIRDGRDVALSTISTNWEVLNYFSHRDILHGRNTFDAYKDVKSRLDNINFFRKIGTYLPPVFKIWLQKNYPACKLWRPPKLSNLKTDYILQYEPLQNTYFNSLWRWREWIKKFQKDAEYLGVDYLTIRYEELVKEPIDKFTQIFDFLGEEFSPELMSYKNYKHYSGKKGDIGSFSCIQHNNINTERINKWSKELNENQKKMTSNFFDDFLVEMGYPPTV